MAQDLFSISLESFDLQIYKIPSKTLVGLIKEIYELKHTAGKYWSIEKIKDIERKETRIMKELQRRGYLNSSVSGQYQEWLNKINHKKKVW